MSEWERVNWSTTNLDNTRLPWLRLKLPWAIPKEILEEAKQLKHLFVDHRAQDYAKENNSYGHSGWKSLCVHGLSARHTQDHDPDIKNVEAMYSWTEIAPHCPVTVAFFKKTFAYNRYHRLRFMLLEAGGYILPHQDNNDRRLGPVNIALNNPEGCDFYMRGYGKVPFEAGAAFKMDVGVEHAVWNRSTEDRYHMIVHGDPNFNVWDGFFPESIKWTKGIYEAGAHLY